MNFPLGQATAKAQILKRDHESFVVQFPPSNANGGAFPTFTWRQLERQLIDLASEQHLASFAQTLVKLRSSNPSGLPPELLLREILVLAAIVQEERPPISTETSSMGEDSSMP
ncbi:MAG: hypothetical protein BGN86_01795 [Caulobacterales bacterium 68-7]|nr:MAG: hypothetical protein BGN86_01795 [Caulobacterales bacterium 68-7]